jgi:hypothetical protein
MRPTQVDLAVLRGSKDPIKCKACHADMDTLLAYCGERVSSEIVRFEDPQQRTRIGTVTMPSFGGSLP